MTRNYLEVTPAGTITIQDSPQYPRAIVYTFYLPEALDRFIADGYSGQHYIQNEVWFPVVGMFHPRVAKLGTYALTDAYAHQHGYIFVYRYTTPRTFGAERCVGWAIRSHTANSQTFDIVWDTYANGKHGIL